ncbi:MAG: hypothetical protein H7Z10_02815, partial [Gemmatimonadaceae bacterium]|nr:hypothetical protein [Acetobacteraceae bacterium]
MTGTVRRIDDRGRWHKPVVVGASVVFHAALLGLLVWNAQGIDIRFEPDARDLILIPVEMEPRPLLPGEVGRVRAVPGPADRPATTQPSPSEPARVANPSFRDPPEDEEDDTRSVSIAIAPSPPAAARLPGDSWRVRPSPGDGRGFIASGPLTCRNVAALSPVGRAT